MKPNIIAFEKHISNLMLDPEDDKLLYYSEEIREPYYDSEKQCESYRLIQSDVTAHWDGYLDRVLEKYELTLEEVRTAYLFVNTYLRILKNPVYDFILEDTGVFLKRMLQELFDGVSIVPMSDEELDERIKFIEFEEYGVELAKAYLFGRTSISRSNYNKLQRWIEYDMMQRSPFFKLEGPLNEEFEYHKEMALMQCDISEFYTIKSERYDSWLEEFVTMYHTTTGWNQYSKVSGFKEAFEKFIENFKQFRKERFEQKIQELKANGSTTSKMILLKRLEGFTEEIKIVE